MGRKRWPPHNGAVYTKQPFDSPKAGSLRAIASQSENHMQQTQEPPVTADNESFWAGLLSMIRAIVLGRRLPPDQLRTFLLFAPPIEVLSAAQIYELLHRNDEYRGYLDLPEEWTDDAEPEPTREFTIGYQFEFDDRRVADSHANVDFLTELLRSEHPEWSDDWDTCFDDIGNAFLCWRVLDEQRRLTPIAAWMAGKMELLEGQRVFSEAYVKKAVTWMIEDYITRLLVRIAALHTWDPHRKVRPEQIIAEDWGPQYVEPFMVLDVKALPVDAPLLLAEWMVANGLWKLEWEGPDYTLEQFIEALKGRQWLATTERPARRQKTFLAA